MTDTPLDRTGFATFFEAVRGHEPFPWQDELAARLVEEPTETAVPDVISVPTGLGKTAVIDAWAYALAVRVLAGAEALPRRLYFVVDRRLVVDAAAVHARELAGLLAEAAADPGRAHDGRDAIARTLAGMCGHATAPLEVVRMRGGVTWDSRWLARPDQPAVVVGTVDQFGSRLLFRGYAQSQRMWPVDAALTGLDTWLMVDEAHLAGPLRQTVDEVRAHQQRVPLELPRRLHMTSMSATTGQARSPLTATTETESASSALPRAAAEADRRLHASKPTYLIELAHLSGPPGRPWAEKAQQLGAALGDLARALAEPGTLVGVVANTVGTARATFELLRGHGETAALLTGRCREFERETVLAEWQPVARVGAARDPSTRCFLVATQTIEVGVDFDLDAIVTECAPLASLVQRFGRVNRIGSRPEHRSAVVRAGFAHDDDPVYGQATDATWRLLVERAGDHVSIGRRDVGRRWPEPGLDLEPAEARHLREQAPAATEVAGTFTPVLLGAHLERWAQTSPLPEPDQPVAPFLHGAERGTPDVAVAWRGAPPASETDTSDVERWRRWLDLAPPAPWEFVDVPVWEVRGLLSARVPAAPTPDVEGAPDVDGEAPSDGVDDAVRHTLAGLVKRPGEEQLQPIGGPADVAPGDRVVLASEVGGHDEWGWTGANQSDPPPPVPDVGDLAPTRRRGLRRLCWEVLASWSVVDDGSLRQALADLDPDDPQAAGTVADALDALTAAAAGQPIGRDPTPLLAAYETARDWSPVSTGFTGPGGKGTAVVLVDRRSGATRGGTVRDDDEVSTSLTADRSVTLAAHGAGVGERARAVAVNLGLPEELVAAVELAGRWHDLGKADERFQLMLHDGDPLAAAGAPEALAKSGRDPRDPVARAARRVAGLPRGFRHEARSARLVADLVAAGVPTEHGTDGELVLHLVAAHHGRARPLLPPVLDPDSPRLLVEVDGREVADPGSERQVDWAHPRRFERLQRRYGWWGLALLEAVVRLADMGCSEEGG